jgi:hypothetical protein
VHGRRVGTVAVYDVVRGVLWELPVGNKAGETCVVSGTAATSAGDLTAPASRTGFYYLVRGTNACGTGGFGTTSAGAPRTTSACP